MLSWHCAAAGGPRLNTAPRVSSSSALLRVHAAVRVWLCGVTRARMGKPKAEAAQAAAAPAAAAAAKRVRKPAAADTPAAAAAPARPRRAPKAETAPAAAPAAAHKPRGGRKPERKTANTPARARAAAAAPAAPAPAQSAGDYASDKKFRNWVFVSKTYAMNDYKLSAKDLSALEVFTVPNPGPYRPRFYYDNAALKARRAHARAACTRRDVRARARK
jgi:hypothetical protein